MAMTSGTTDVGSTKVDAGGRARAGGQRNGGDSFANTLDNHMQSPRNEAPRERPAPKRETEKKQEVSSEKNESPKAESAKSDAAKESKSADSKKKSDADDSASGTTEQAAVSTVGEQKSEPTEATNSSFVDNIAALLQGGKNLPQAATAAGVTAEIVGNTSAASQGTSASAGGSTTYLSSSTTGAAGSVAEAQRPSANAVDLAALANGRAIDPAVKAEAGVTAKSDAANALLTSTQSTSSSGTDGLLQAMRMSLGGQGASAKGESDDFSALLAGLREASGRGAETTVATPTVSTTGATPSPALTTGTSATPSAQPINVPVGDKGWDQAMGERVLWMTNQNLKEAKIELHPRELGPVEVRVSVQQDQATVTFTAHTPAAKEALEASMPRLREMLADSGLNLAQSDVFHQSPQQQQGNWGEGGQSARGGVVQGGGAPEESAAVVAETPVSKLDRGVDYYA